MTKKESEKKTIPIDLDSVAARVSALADDNLCYIISSPRLAEFLTNLLRIPKKPSTSINTLAVVLQDGIWLLYNPYFVSQLSDDETRFCLAHESMHLALLHFDRFKTIADNPTLHQLANLAADAVVNRILLSVAAKTFKFNSSKLSENIVTLDRLIEQMGKQFARKYQLSEESSAEEIFLALADFTKSNSISFDLISFSNCNCKLGESSNNSVGGSESNQEQENDSSKGNRNGEPGKITKTRVVIGSGGSPIYVGEVFETDTNLEAEAAEIMSHIIGTEIDDKQAGIIPGGELAEIGRKYNKPVLDWKKILRKFVGVSEHFEREIKWGMSRRRRTISPTFRKNFLPEIIVAVDTSGSISEKELEEFFREIDALANNRKVRLIEFDAEIQADIKRFRRNQKIEIKGRGGTAYKPVLSLLKGENRNRSKLIIFTDGYPSDSDCLEDFACYRDRVLFVLTKNRDGGILDPQFDFIRKYFRTIGLDQ